MGTPGCVQSPDFFEGPQVMSFIWCCYCVNTFANANSSNNQESSQELHASTDTQCLVSNEHWTWLAGQNWFFWYRSKLRFWGFLNNCFFLRLVVQLFSWMVFRISEVNSYIDGHTTTSIQFSTVDAQFTVLTETLLVVGCYIKHSRLSVSTVVK